MRRRSGVADPLWYKRAIIYELPVKSFFDANNDGIGDFEGLVQKLDYLESVFPVLVNAGAAVESAKLVSAEQAAVLEQELEEYKISIGRGSQVEPEKLDSLATRAGAVFNPPAQQPYSSQPLLLAGGALLLIVAFFAAKLLAKRRKKAK